ncbi:MAG: alpha/beta hydrolase [Paracoccaceae bacterium]|nr:alpha/beta hydrolase [Paracoccaceae bacterium]
MLHRSLGGRERWEDTPPVERQALAARIHLVAAGAPAIYDDRAGLMASGRLEATPVTTLLLEGTASPPVVHAIAEALALRLPNARRETIAGAGHMGPISHPAEVAAAIRRHIGL